MLKYNATTPNSEGHVDNLDAALNGAHAAHLSHCGNGNGDSAKTLHAQFALGGAV